MERPTEVQIALRRQDIIRPLAFMPYAPFAKRKSAALILERSDKTIKTWIDDYRQFPVLETLMPGHRAGGKRKSRLPTKTLSIMAKLIENEWLGRQESMSAQDLLIQIEEECEKATTLPPSLSTLRRRLKALSNFRKAEAKKIPGDPRIYLNYHHHHVDWPYQEIQIDHTPVDLFLDLSEYGLGFKRIWVTVAVDVASRLVFGYYLGLKAPSARSGGLALIQGVLPKRRWVEECGISYSAFEEQGIPDPWPTCGPIDLVRADKGADFKSYAFKMGCLQLGADVKFRPGNKTHYGGHIERLLGTFMKRIHGIPGTTFSNHVQRDRYPSIDKCFLSLEKFEFWFVNMILAYHTNPHKGLGGLTPLQKYQQLQSLRPPRAKLVLDPQDIYSAFLPSVHRTVHKGGITFQKYTYGHSRLQELIGERLRIKYHPGRLDKVWVCLSGAWINFPAHQIGPSPFRHHLEAPLDIMHTAVVKEETKRQFKISKQLKLQQAHWIKDMEKQGRLNRGSSSTALIAPTPVLQIEDGRPEPSLPGNWG